MPERQLDLLNTTELGEKHERERAISELQSTIDAILLAAPVTDRHWAGKNLNVLINTGDDDSPDLAWVGRNLDPDDDVRYGIRWEYQVGLIVPVEEGESDHETHYFVTDSGEMIIIDLDQIDYFPVSIPGQFTLPDDLAIEVELDIREGLNGQPTPISEIILLTDILQTSSVINPAINIGPELEL